MQGNRMCNNRRRHGGRRVEVICRGDLVDGLDD